MFISGCLIFAFKYALKQVQYRFAVYFGTLLNTICQRTILYSSLQYKKGHYFLGTQQIFTFICGTNYCTIIKRIYSSSELTNQKLDNFFLNESGTRRTGISFMVLYSINVRHLKVNIYVLIVAGLNSNWHPASASYINLKLNNK